MIGTEDRVDGNDPDFVIGTAVFGAGHVAATVLDDHFHHERHVVGQRGQHVAFVDDFDVGIGLNIGTGEHAGLVGFERDHASCFAVIPNHQAFDIQNDLGDVFQDTGDRCEFVLGTTNLDLSDGTAHQTAEQHAAQAVADAGAKTAFKGFGHKLAVIRVERIAIDFQAAGQFHATPTNVHRQGNLASGLRGRVFSESRGKKPRRLVLKN